MTTVVDWSWSTWLWVMLGLGLASLTLTRVPRWRQWSTRRWCKNQLRGVELTDAQRADLETELTVRSRALAVGGLIGACLGAGPLLVLLGHDVQSDTPMYLPVACFGVFAGLARSSVVLVRESRGPSQPGVRVAMSTRIRSSMFQSWVTVVFLVLSLGLSLTAGALSLTQALRYDGGFTVGTRLVLGVMIGIVVALAVAIGVSWRVIRAPLGAADEVGLVVAQALRREASGGLPFLLLTQAMGLVSLVTSVDTSNVPIAVRRATSGTHLMFTEAGMVAALIGMLCWWAYSEKSRPARPAPASRPVERPTSVEPTS